MDDPDKYERCMVMGGGGFRFCYYLGMHAAAVDAGKAPDLLLASCGGALAAAIVHLLPSNEERLAFARSSAMYGFLGSIASTPKAAPGVALYHAARRWMRRSHATTVPDLFDDYLFVLPRALPLPAGAARGPDVAIVGARLLFGREHVAQPRAGRALFTQTVFANPRACALLAGAPSPVGGGAISQELAVDASMPLADAVRISIADMVYFSCHRVGDAHYTGGVIDLVPIELAHRLARSVMVETKPPFNQLLAIPALRSVFGIDGNARMRAVHVHPADIRIDTSDMAAALARRGARKRIDWRRWRLALAPPPSLQAFADDVQAMWEFGYRRTMDAVRSAR